MTRRSTSTTPTSSARIIAASFKAQSASSSRPEQTANDASTHSGAIAGVLSMLASESRDHAAPNPLTAWHPAAGNRTSGPDTLAVPSGIPDTIDLAEQRWKRRHLPCDGCRYCSQMKARKIVGLLESVMAVTS